LHLVPTFVYSRAYAREFPEAVQTGPFWPEKFAAPSLARARSIRNSPSVVLWYASPSSSDRLAQKLAADSSLIGREVRIQVRSPRKLFLPSSSKIHWEVLPALRPAEWRRRFRQADLRIVTGSRTLLEAIELGRPFLYFNGVLGRGRRTRRHRPEKLSKLIALWRRNKIENPWIQDLNDFSRLRRVGPVLGRALEDVGWRRRFPDVRQADGFRPPFDDARILLLSIVRRFSRGRTSTQVVADARAQAIDD